MRPKLFIAAIAAAFTLTALPASAQYYGDRDRYRQPEYGQRYRQPGYHPPIITVRTDRGTITARRGERLYYQLKAGPYHFKDGRIYTYRECYRYRCTVSVYDPNWTTRPTNVVSAPPIEPLLYSSYDRNDRYRRRG